MEMENLLGELYKATFHNKIVWTKVITHPNTFSVQIGDKTINLQKSAGQDVCYTLQAYSSAITFINLFINHSLSDVDVAKKELAHKIEVLYKGIISQWENKRKPDVESLMDALLKLNKSTTP